MKYAVRKNVTSREAADIDEGLRTYMLSVYNLMGAGLAVTGIVAWLTASNPALFELFFAAGEKGVSPTPLGWIVVLAPLGMVFVISARYMAMSIGTLQGLFWGFSAMMGVSLSEIFLAYTGSSITEVFLISAGAFAGLSLWGYVTKRDLNGFGSFLIVGLLGIVIASIVNIFLGSPAFDFVISVIGVLVFAGLTAYDTQKIRMVYDSAEGAENTTARLAVIGALTLYLDLINLFLMLLRLFGQRR